MTVLCCISTFVLYTVCWKLEVGRRDDASKNKNILISPVALPTVYDFESGPQLSSLCLRTRATNSVTSYTN